MKTIQTTARMKPKAERWGLRSSTAIGWCQLRCGECTAQLVHVLHSSLSGLDDGLKSPPAFALRLYRTSYEMQKSAIHQKGSLYSAELTSAGTLLTLP